jgi:hypothetical protein
MVWECFTANGLGPLVRIDGRQTSKNYIQTLENYLLPFLETLDEHTEYIFQDDNASIHRAHNIKR